MVVAFKDLLYRDTRFCQLNVTGHDLISSLFPDDDPFELHFSLRGPANSPYETGIYHGVLALAENYPFEPPSVIFMTPSGRFVIEKPICLSSSAYHAELWQPSWSIRMFLISLRTFMLEVPYPVILIIQ